MCVCWSVCKSLVGQSDGVRGEVKVEGDQIQGPGTSVDYLGVPPVSTSLSYTPVASHTGPVERSEDFGGRNPSPSPLLQ